MRASSPVSFEEDDPGCTASVGVAPGGDGGVAMASLGSCSCSSGRWAAAERVVAADSATYCFGELVMVWDRDWEPHPSSHDERGLSGASVVKMRFCDRDF
jgi:hypothetical protein